ncbi:hypothetical protein HYPSUDRAFT_90259 [Hypholoma sublateritium FD-334 SS-4]|uniref:Uncharacterized protein n=1 Tax=Hypholoma sublateritium (strain FD-334 SS-4) TaxID=945553 RepID=A0A0D2M4F9_HYPSF|nr:hypothetical protein HYPSUDRAFT_90259 [Hypholoma sublateritium FD-334 SS-4]
MSQSNSEPTDAPTSAPSLPGPEIITVRAITSNQQPPQYSTSLPLSVPTVSTSSSNTVRRENARVLQPFASSSSSLARTKSPLRQSSVASQDAPPPGVFRSPPQPVSTSSARIGSSASSAAVAANLNASTASPRVEPGHHRLPGSAATVHVSAMHSPAPVSFARSPALPPGFQPYPSAPPLPPSQPPPFAHSSVSRSQSNNVYPSNLSSQSSGAPGMAPPSSGMRVQSSPSYYPTYGGSQHSRVNQTTSSSSQRPRPGFSHSDMPPLINAESYVPRMSSTYPEYTYQRTPSRKPTMDAYVANDPFRSHSQRNTTPVDNNVTFDDIPVPSPEEVHGSRRYMASSNSRPNTVSAPPAPIPLYPGQPPVPSEYVPPVVQVYSGQTPVASEYVKRRPSLYRPNTGSAQSSSSQPAPMYDATPPLEPIYTQVYSQRSDYPPTYVSGGDPGRIIDLNQGNGDEDTPPSPIRTSDPDSTAGADQVPQPPRWNADIPLVPVRRTTDESWHAPYPYDYRPADTVNIDPTEYLPFPDNNTYAQYMGRVSNDTGFWSRVGNMFRTLLPKKSRYGYAPPIELESQKARYRAAAAFVGKTLPRQIYLHLLLRLPSLYFSRVARIFEEADLTLPEIKKMALETASQGSPDSFDALSFESGITAVPPQYQRLKTTWESFIDSVMREWKTFNIISVLLLSAILTILQISGAADDPVTRYLALLSLMCALMSLLFGCMYIIRFGSMRKTYKAAEWALEAKKSKTVIWWNVWVLLAMPVIWLTWSIVLYIACIMSFIWRTNAQDTQTPPVLSHVSLLLIRILLSSVLGLGFIYGALVLSTFSRYGEAMDRAWKRRIDGWVQEKKFVHVPAPYPPQPYYPTFESAPSGEPSGAPQYSSQEPHPTPSWYNSNKSSQPPQATSYTETPYNRPSSPLGSDGSDESTSSTLYATQSNTLHNKISTFHPEEDMAINFPVFKGPVYISDHPLPQPPRPLPRTTSESARLDPYAPRKAGLAVPPPHDLPPIPGSAIPPVRVSGPPVGDDGRSTSEDEYASRPRSFAMEEEEEEPENRVRFRSPLISAKASSFGGSDPDSDPGRPVFSDPSINRVPSPSSAQESSVEVSSAQEFYSPQESFPTHEPTVRSNTASPSLATHENEETLNAVLSLSSVQGSSTQEVFSAEQSSPAHESTARSNTPPSNLATHENAVGSTSSQNQLNMSDSLSATP